MFSRYISVLAVQLLSCSILFAVIAATPLHAKTNACLPMIIAEGKRLSDLADEVEREHKSSLTKLYMRHKVPTKALSDPSSVPAVGNIMTYYRVGEARADLIERVIASLNATDFSEGSGNRCPTESRVRSAYDSNLATYENLLEEVRNVAENRLDANAMRSGEGLWLAVIKSDSFIQSAKITRRGSLVGSQTLWNIEPGSYVRLVSLKEGVYGWKDLQWGSGPFKRWIDLTGDDKLFEIKRGKLNYAGVLDVRSGGQGYYIELRDRLTVVVSLLEERMPDLLEDFEVANGLNPNDQFIDFYIEQRVELRPPQVAGAGE